MTVERVTTCKHVQRIPWDCGCSGYDRFCCGATSHRPQCTACQTTLADEPTQEWRDGRYQDREGPTT